MPALPRSDRKERVRGADGTVAFDLGHLVPAGAQLPRFGLLRRRGAPTGGVAARFASALRSALAGGVGPDAERPSR